MKIHRFVSQYESTDTGISVIDTETIFQIHTVLKLCPGERIILSDGKGSDKEIILNTVTKKSVLGTLYRETHRDKKPTVHAYIALLKRDNLELAIQKMVELGITDITPLITARTIKKGYNTDRLQKIIVEATEQSGQSYLPTLHSETPFKEALDQAKENTDVCIFFNETGDTENTMSIKNKTVCFFIGPEGGFTPEEIALSQDKEIVAVSLGDTTLRGETAAIVGTFWIKERQ